MVSFNVYRATSSGAYVEGVCLATDEKPVTGIANGSILYAVDASNGETTRYMYDQSTASWIEANLPDGGGSGGGEGGGSGDGGLYLLTETEEGIEQSYNDIKAAFDAGKRIEMHQHVTEDGLTGTSIFLLSAIAEPVPTRDVTAKPYAVQLCTLDSTILALTNFDPNEPLTREG